MRAGPVVILRRNGIVNAADLNELALHWREFVPFSGAVAVDAGSNAYVQTFDDTLGTDGTATGIKLPLGWSVINDRIEVDSTTGSFPVGSVISTSNTSYNAGMENASDRTLAVGVAAGQDEVALELLAQVIATDANSFQLQFDVEAWDSADGFRVGNTVLQAADDPGEAAFKLTVDIDLGDGFTSLFDLGTITTGPTPRADVRRHRGREVPTPTGLLSIVVFLQLRFQLVPISASAGPLILKRKPKAGYSGSITFSLRLFPSGATDAVAVPEPSAPLQMFFGLALIIRRATACRCRS